jgi:hypothetical protein
MEESSCKIHSRRVIDSPSFAMSEQMKAKKNRKRFRVLSVFSATNTWMSNDVFLSFCCVVKKHDLKFSHELISSSENNIQLEILPPIKF